MHNPKLCRLCVNQTLSETGSHLLAQIITGITLLHQTPALTRRPTSPDQLPACVCVPNFLSPNLKEKRVAEGLTQHKSLILKRKLCIQTAPPK